MIKTTLSLQNMTVKRSDIIKVVENENFQKENKMTCLIYLLKTLIVGTRRGGSNQYPKSMFRIKHKKGRYNPAYPSFTTCI